MSNLLNILCRKYYERGSQHTRVYSSGRTPRFSTICPFHSFNFLAVLHFSTGQQVSGPTYSMKSFRSEYVIAREACAEMPGDLNLSFRDPSNKLTLTFVAVQPPHRCGYDITIRMGERGICLRCVNCGSRYVFNDQPPF